MDYEKKYKEALEVAKRKLCMDKAGMEDVFTPDDIREIFPELAESEDEKIIYDAIKEVCNVEDARAFAKHNETVFNVAKRVLKKQGEHAKFCDSIQIGDKVTRNEDGVLVNLSQLNRVAKKQGEQKPVEWSEEDENHIDSILQRLEGMCKHGATFTRTRFAVSEDKDWLKSFRPQKLSNMERNGKNWKPSDEQMEVLNEVIRNPYLSTAEYNGLIALREQLKAL